MRLAGWHEAGGAGWDGLGLTGWDGAGGMGWRDGLGWGWAGCWECDYESITSQAREVTTCCPKKEIFCDQFSVTNFCRSYTQNQRVFLVH